MNFILAETGRCEHTPIAVGIALPCSAISVQTCYWTDGLLSPLGSLVVKRQQYLYALGIRCLSHLSIEDRPRSNMYWWIPWPRGNYPLTKISRNKNPFFCCLNFTPAGRWRGGWWNLWRNAGDWILECINLVNHHDTNYSYSIWVRSGHYRGMYIYTE